MRLRPRALLAAAAATVALIVPFAGTPAAQGVAAHKGTLIAPCAKAKVTKANTGFTCDLVPVPRSKTKAIVAKIEASTSMEAALTSTAAGGTGGTCSVTGCYDWFSNQHSGYDAIGSYGWRYDDGSYQRIGTITIEIDDYLTGNYTTKTAPFCWGTTHSAPMYLIIERYYATTAGAPSGPQTIRERAISPQVTVLSNGKYCLPASGNSDGYGGTIGNVLTDSQTARGTIYHYVTWRAAGFTGKWYAYAKSWIFYRPDCCSYLRYYSPTRLPASPANASWLPY